MTERLVDKKEIARLLSVSTRQVDRLGVPYIKVGKVRRYTPSEVMFFLGREVKTTNKIDGEIK